MQLDPYGMSLHALNCDIKYSHGKHVEPTEEEAPMELGFLVSLSVPSALP